MSWQVWGAVLLSCTFLILGCDSVGTSTTMPVAVEGKATTTQATPISDDEVMKLVVDDLRIMGAAVPEGPATISRDQSYIYVTWTRELPQGARGSELVLQVTIDPVARRVIRREIGV